MKGIQKTGREKHVPFLYFLIGNLVLFDWRIIVGESDDSVFASAAPKMVSNGSAFGSAAPKMFSDGSE